MPVLLIVADFWISLETTFISGVARVTVACEPRGEERQWKN
jgi:hypothetical protein